MRRMAVAAVLGWAACGGDKDGTDGPTDVPDLNDRVYQLSLNDLVVDGAADGLADVLRLFFTSPVLIHTYDDDGGGFSARLAYGDGAGAQDPCGPTSDFPAATRSGEAFSMGPADTTIFTTTTSFVVTSLTVDGTVNADGGGLVDVSLTGGVDLRQAVGFAGFNDIDAICTTFGALDVVCEACPDSEVACVSLSLGGLKALSSDITVTAITPADAAASCPE